MAKRRIGAYNREAERRLTDALQERLAVTMRRQMRASIVQDYKRAAEQVEKGNVLVTLTDTDTGRIVLTGWERAVETFGRRMADQIGKRHGSLERKERVAEYLSIAFQHFAQRWIATKVTEIDGTTEKHIRELVEYGMQEGQTLTEIGLNLMKVSSEIARYRSHVIARTETHFAAGFANETAAEESGLDLEKEWVAAWDDRTRETHIEADGQRVPLGGRFNVGGYELEYPGDASGPAEEVIMCRCVATYIEV